MRIIFTNLFPINWISFCIKFLIIKSHKNSELKSNICTKKYKFKKN